MKNHGNIYSKHKVHLFNANKSTKIFKCHICQKEIKSIPAFTTHVLRSHKIDIDDYIYKYLHNLTPEFKFEKCGFCDKLAVPKIIYDFTNYTYKLSYDEGYMCMSEQCVDNICMHFFNDHYCNVKHRYEHIGANTEFLSKRYKMPIDQVKTELKRDKNFKFVDSQKTNLSGYISRHGLELGTKLYNERCQKIARSMTVDWFIERFGIVDGIKKYEERIEKTIQNASNITQSKNQCLIFDRLKQLDVNWEAERFVGGIGCVDMVNKSLRFAIEYFGDYWHCNPSTYDKDFFNKSLKMTAAEKQRFDIERLNKMLLYSNEIDYMLVIWEKSFYNFGIDDIILQIENIIKTHTAGKKDILWI